MALRVGERGQLQADLARVDDVREGRLALDELPRSRAKRPHVDAQRVVQAAEEGGGVSKSAGGRRQAVGGRGRGRDSRSHFWCLPVDDTNVV